MANTEVPLEVQSADASVLQPEEVPSTDENALQQQQPEVKEEKEDPIKKALLEQIEQIVKETTRIKSELLPEGTTVIAEKGGALMKKRKKTFYKKYKSKISMKRRNKTVKNN